MRILALMTFDIFRHSLGGALVQSGHQVLFLEDFTTGKLEEEIVRFKPEMIVDMGWDVWHQIKHMSGELYDVRQVIKKHNIFHLYFAEEDWLHFERWSKRYCSIMRPDFVLTRSPYMIRNYEDMGIPATFFDVGVNPEFHKPVPLVPAYTCDVAVVANGNFTKGELRYRSIYDLVLPLLKENNLNVKIWGRDWDNIGWCYPGQSVPEKIFQGLLPFTETNKVYSSAKVSISIQTCKDQLSNRTLDVMASGGFLLTSNTKAVRERLRPGVNCAVSDSPAETLRLVRYYLEHESERREIAEEGRRYALEHFTYQKSLQRVWSEIEVACQTYRQSKIKKEYSPHNLLKDGQFLNPSDKAWVVHNAECLTEIGYLGSGSVAFETGKTNSFIQQKVPVIPGKTYLLTAWFANRIDGMGAPVNLMVQYYTADNKMIDIGLYLSVFQTDFYPVNWNQWVLSRGLTKAVPPEAAYALVLINKIGYEHNNVPVLISKCSLIENEI